jgi:predicted MFS family arabinose efflux permease
LPAIARAFHTHVGAAGLAVTGYLASYALCQLCYGPLGDRVAPVTLIRISLATFAGGTALCAIAPSLGVLVAFRILTGIAAAAVIPMALTHIGNTVSLEHRTRALGMFLSTLMAGQALGAVFGGLLAEFVSWRAIFVILGGSAALTAAMLGTARPRTDHPEPANAEDAANRPGTRLAILRDGAALFLCLGIESFAVAGAFPYVGAALIERFHLTYGVTGAILSLFAAGSLLGSRAPLRAPGLRLRVGGVVLSVAYGLIALQRSVAVSAIGIAALGIGFSLAHSTLQTIATEISPSRRASTLSLFSFISNAAGALGTAVTGAAFDEPGPGALYAAQASVLLLFAIASPRLLARGSVPATESSPA